MQSRRVGPEVVAEGGAGAGAGPPVEAQQTLQAPLYQRLTWLQRAAGEDGAEAGVALLGEAGLPLRMGPPLGQLLGAPGPGEGVGVQAGAH